MNLFRLARLAGAFSLLAGGLSSCLQEPSYSTTPSIEFDSIEPHRVTKANQLPVDSLVIAVRFQDGDGDLGLTEAESKLAPYSPGKFTYNYFIEPYVKIPATGKFVSLASTGRLPLLTSGVIDYNGRFEHLSASTDSKNSALKGVLKRSITFIYGSPFVADEEIRFRVCIVDRALHLSDTITTSSFIVPKL
jgi:hypothetical protein